MEKITHALLRVVTGFLFLQHGAPAEIMSIYWVAGLLEAVGGFLIMIGAFTRPVAFVLAGEMAVAYWWGHFPAGGFWPIVNGGELAALYCFVFLYLSTKGSGKLER